MHIYVYFHVIDCGVYVNTNGKTDYYKQGVT